MRKTILHSISCKGMALRNCKNVEVIMKPANANDGIIFRRIDCTENRDIHANLANIVRDSD